MRSSRSLSARIEPSSSGGTARPLSISEAIRASSLASASVLLSAVARSNWEPSPAYFGGKLRQCAVRGDVGDDAAQRHHGLLELLECQRIALGRLSGCRKLVDLMRQRADGLFETGQAFGRREVAERVADLGELAFERSERRAIGAGLPGAVDPLGQGPDFGFERLDGSPRHGVGQRPPDLGQIAPQRAKCVLVGLMQRRNLRVDVVKLLLQAGQVRSATRVRRCGRGWSRGGRSPAVERALARGNLCGPVGGTAAGRGRR